MLLKKIEIEKYRNFEKVVIDLDENKPFPVFSIASTNGGGKSTLLQFVFVLLHCFNVENKKNFIKNMLENLEIVESKKKLAKFIVKDDEEEYYLEFFIAPCNYEDKNFNLFLDLKETDLKIHETKEKNNSYIKLLELKKLANDTERITPILESNLRHVRDFINNSTDDRLYMNARRSNNIEDYRRLVNSIIASNNISMDNVNELENIYSLVQEKTKILETILKEEELEYVTHLLNNENVLLLKTNMNKQLLTKLSTKIFLTAPSSQIFHFMSKEEKYRIFKNFTNEKKYNYSYDSYGESVQDAKNNLENFFTYDFASTELILKSFEKAFEEDRKIKVKTSKYGTNYDELRKELNDFLEGKTISVDEDFKRVIFKLKNNEQELGPEDLSHGELKKLSIYIWLKYIVEKDSIILMDEVDIALHPKWQYEINKDLKIWSQNSQFFLATHSPQILSSTYYKNIIKLETIDSKVKVKRFSKPPLDRDINTTTTEIMGATDFPKELLELHKRYRKLINEGKVQSEEAKTLKKEILENESENSSFFQDINFDLELM